MKEKLTVVKVGGAVVEDPAQLEGLLEQFRAIGGRKVLVHGGGRRATKMAQLLGIETTMVDGRRVTDAAMLDVVTMVYGGLVNKQVVARLQALDVNAIGLCGADADIIRSHRRSPVARRTTDDATADGATADRTEAEVEMVDFGFVGDVDRVDSDVLEKLLEAGLTPVVAPLTHDGQGTILNTNADTMASETAKALAGKYDVTLVFAFEKKGVLSNPDDDNSVMATITRNDYDRYRADGIIAGGMLPKIENALAAVEAGVQRVVITTATAIDGHHGTEIRK